MDEILNTRSKISSSSPNVLNESYFFRVNLKFFSQPAIVELDTFIFEEDIFVRFIEDLNAQHHKATIVPTSETDVVQIIESEHELRTNERIGWSLHLSSHAKRLEAENTSSNIINIASPASYHRISVNFSAGNSC